MICDHPTPEQGDFTFICPPCRKSHDTSTRQPHPGVTLLEMLVVLAIIAAMASLLMPALQHARESASRAACKNNLRQLSLAMRGFAEAYKRLPDPAPPNSAGGWSIAIMPFMEQGALAERPEENPSLDPGAMSPHARHRPAILTCPSADDVESPIPTVPIAHYVLVATANRDSWILGDAPRDSRVPWIVSPEMPPGYERRHKGPHTGGFNIADTTGSVRFVIDGSR